MAENFELSMDEIDVLIQMVQENLPEILFVQNYLS